MTSTDTADVEERRRLFVAFNIRLLIGIPVLFLMATKIDAQGWIRDHSKRVAASVSDRTDITDADRGRLALSAYANCLVSDNQKRVVDFLKIQTDDPAYRKAAVNLATDDCMESGTLQFSEPLLRGALYTSLYRIRFKDASPPLREHPISFGDRLTDTSSPRAKEYAVRMNFADCVVRRDPKSSRELVIGPTASRAEGVALAKLVPSLSPCIVQGATVKFNMVTLAGLIAEALYEESRSRGNLPEP